MPDFVPVDLQILNEEIDKSNRAKKLQLNFKI